MSHLKILLCIYLLYYAAHVQKISRHLSYFIKSIMLLLCESVYYITQCGYRAGISYTKPEIILLVPRKTSLFKISALERNNFFIKIKTNS